MVGRASPGHEIYNEKTTLKFFPWSVFRAKGKKEALRITESSGL